MKKYAKFILCVVLIIALNTVAAYAADTDNGKADDGIFAALDEVKAKGSFLEYRDNYYLDMEDVSILSSPGAVIFNMLANGIFGWSKNIGCLTAVATRFALGVDIYNLIRDFIEPFFNSMRKIVFDSYATYFIAIAAFYFLVQLLRNRHSQVISGLLAVTMIIAVGLFFYARPMFVLSTLNGITTELSSTVMDAPYDTLTDEDSDEATAGDKSVVLIFNVMVHSQWQYLEFGSMKQAQNHEASILPLEVDSDERLDYISELEKPGLTKGNTAAQIERFGLALIFFIFDLLLLIIILGFSVLILGYQFFVLFLAILGTFIFVLALIPGYGTRLLRRWALKLLSSSAVKIILVFFMAILFIIMNFLYTATATYGLLPVLFMMLSMCLIVALKRKEIAELFLGTSGGKVVGAAGDIAHGTYSELTGLKDKLSDLRRGQEREMDDEEDDERERREDRLNRRTNEYLSEEELRRYRRQMDAGQRREDRSGTRETSDATQQDGHDTGRSSEQVQQSEDNNGLQQMQGRVLQGEYFTGEDYKKAEEILEQNYQLSKLKSERTAKESGELAQYSDFVQRTDAIRELGGGSMFDDRDILKTARILQRTEAAGGSMDDLIGDPQERNSGDRNLSRQEELRPQSVMDYMSETTQEELRVNNTDSVVAAASDYRDSDIHKGHENVGDVVAEQSTAVQAERQGLSFFKEQFGEEKGEKYYEKMCSKYGEEVVSQFSSEEQVSYSAVNQILRNNMGEKQ
ncbi:CD3337/EF1877 family mobilome membrane protein [Emergencia sp. 1XD21-10]|jgi:hypothetical protein|uniref:CD3337/EF1877 family mobilome membrane protein n=1 Tax=Emergencia sp. 1XD21-10 TaxID=2304569 RepID=UPI00137AA327|nr:hypothetical protein [Emergencia sp. 1XD21-10]NCE98826.1 hypothetical protein [Emergencia sp. 1XD21-10]